MNRRIPVVLATAGVLALAVALRWLAVDSAASASGDESAAAAPASLATPANAPAPTTDEIAESASRRDEVAADASAVDVQQGAASRVKPEVRETFEIHVTDANGDPAEGILTRIFFADPETGRVARMLTNASGVASYDVEWTKLLFRDRPADQRYRVTADLEYSRLASVERTLPEMIAEPTLLVLPPLGAVKVVLRRGATPFDGKAKVKLLRVEEVVDPKKKDAPPQQRTALERDVVTHDGSAVFERVAAGMRVGVEVDHPDGVFETPLSDFVMSLPNATLEIAVDLTAVPNFTMRAISPSTGKPLVAGYLGLEWTAGGRVGSSGGVDLVRRVDSTGLVHFSWPSNLALERPAALHIIAIGPEAGAADVDVTRFVAPGEHDLGDVRLVGVSPIASGRVLDAEGKPVVDAFVICVPEKSPDDVRRNAGSINRFLAGTEDDGTFTVEGSTTAKRFRIVAFLRWRGHSSPLAFERGENLTLQLRGVGSCAGAVRGAPADSLVAIESTDFDTAEFAGSPETSRLDGNGRFAIGNIDAGTVRVTIKKNEVVLATLEDVVVPPGGAAGDPRLAAIEIR